SPSPSPPLDRSVARTGPSEALAVVAGAAPVHHHRRLVAHHPRIVSAGQRGDIARPGDEFLAVVHEDREPAGDVVLEVRRLAALRPGQRLDVPRPAPTGLEDQPAYCASADLEDLGLAVGKLASFVRARESPVLAALAHVWPPFS